METPKEKVLWGIQTQTQVVGRWLFDFGCAFDVMNVFVVLLCLDLKTAESRVNVWY